MDLDRLRRSFDRVAEDYAADFLHELDRKPFDREWLGRFARQWRGPGVVLDVGCGPGHIGGFVAAEARAPVLGLDLSVESLRVARRLNPGWAVVAGDMQAMPLRDRACGGLVAFYSLIYADGPATAAVLREFRRVLRPGAPLLLAVHAGEGAERFTEYRGKPIDITIVYQQPEPLAALVRQAGFAVERVEARPPYPFEHPTTRLYIEAWAD